jgi:hypothetical protein
MKQPNTFSAGGSLRTRLFRAPGALELDVSTVRKWTTLWNVADWSRANINELGEAAIRPPNGEMRKV